jgi:DNA repair exonuclease SbcCD nuclease subunit
MDAGLFPSCFDYVALGHLHAPQKVGGAAHVRYSGAPFPMSARCALWIARQKMRPVGGVGKW